MSNNNTIQIPPTTVDSIDQMDKAFNISDNAFIAAIHGYCCVARMKNHDDLFEVFATIGNKVTSVGRLLTDKEAAAIVNYTNTERFAHYFSV